MENEEFCWKNRNSIGITWTDMGNHHNSLSTDVSPTHRRSIIRSRWLWVPALVSLLLVAVFFTAPSAVKNPNKNNLANAVNNARHIGLALLNFETTYGSFPSEATIPKVKVAHPGITISLGTRTANDFFRQLIVAGDPFLEAMFYARAPWTKLPDRLVDGEKALERGECAFSYITGLESSTATPDRPVAVFPLVKGRKKFDYGLSRKFFDGRGFVLTADNRVRVYIVDESGRVSIKGKDFFDPSQPFWYGKAPDVKWPE
jgi:hypothetical protein